MAKTSGHAFVDALVTSGIMTRDEVNDTKRLIIEVAWDKPPTLFIEKFGDGDKLSALAPLIKDMLTRDG